MTKAKQKQPDFEKMYEAAVHALVRTQSEADDLRGVVEAVERDLIYTEKARAATQELLDACLSSDVDAKHSPQANAVRHTMCRMLERAGWLPPQSVNDMKAELEATRRLLAVANKRIEAAIVFGVSPRDVTVSPDGEIAAVPLGPIDLRLAAAPKTAKPKK